MNFAEKSISSNKMDEIKNLLEKIKVLDEQNREYIENDYDASNEDTVKEFVEVHLNDAYYLISDTVGTYTSDTEKTILNKLQLMRIGFYPDGKYGETSFAVFDYGFAKVDDNTGELTNLTDQIICVNVDETGNLLNLSWES